MNTILELIFTYQQDKVRLGACKLFIALTGNNSKVQMFAQKTGANNLSIQFERETHPVLREAVFTCLSSFLKSDNMPGKRQYINELDGIKQLCRWLIMSGKEEAQLLGKENQIRKTKLKLIILI